MPYFNPPDKIKNALAAVIGRMPITQLARGQVSVNGLLNAINNPNRPAPFQADNWQEAIDPALSLWNPVGLLGTIKKIKSNPISYQGQHTPPGRDAAPLHDLTGGGKVYPEDVYTHGARYYGLPEETGLFDIASRFRNRPNKPITIYRAVPYEKTPTEQASEIEAQLAKYLRRGIMPENLLLSKTEKKAGWTDSADDWYGAAREKANALRALPEKDSEVLDINPGDWVTLDRKYAKQHGEASLGGKYKIVSKKVRANELFTNGDSIQEWGWWPDTSGLLSP